MCGGPNKRATTEHDVTEKSQSGQLQNKPISLKASPPMLNTCHSASTVYGYKWCRARGGRASGGQ
jgi:hypothetical protein